jgi:hypothetical protein
VTRSVWTAPEDAWIHGKISPDGRYVPYGDDNGQLLLRDLLSGADRRITSPVARGRLLIIEENTAAAAASVVISRLDGSARREALRVEAPWTLANVSLVPSRKWHWSSDRDAAFLMKARCSPSGACEDHELWRVPIEGAPVSLGTLPDPLRGATLARASADEDLLWLRQTPAGGELWQWSGRRAGERIGRIDVPDRVSLATLSRDGRHVVYVAPDRATRSPLEVLALENLLPREAGKSTRAGR